MNNKNDFTYLRDKIREWRDNGWLIPPSVTSRDRFQLWVRTEIRPTFTLLARILSETGLYTEILDGAEELSPSMGIFLRDFNVTLQLWPGTDPTIVHLSLQGGISPSDDITQDVPYHSMPSGGLRTILSEAVLRVLAPRRPACTPAKVILQKNNS